MWTIHRKECSPVPFDIYDQSKHLFHFKFLLKYFPCMWFRSAAAGVHKGFLFFFFFYCQRADPLFWQLLSPWCWYHSSKPPIDRTWWKCVFLARVISTLWHLIYSLSWIIMSLHSAQGKGKKKALMKVRLVFCKLQLEVTLSAVTKVRTLFWRTRPWWCQHVKVTFYSLTSKLEITFLFLMLWLVTTNRGHLPGKQRTQLTWRLAFYWEGTG